MLNLCEPSYPHQYLRNLGKDLRNLRETSLDNQKMTANSTTAATIANKMVK